MLTLGEFKLYPLSDGYFHLDAGQVFGVVPKTMWSHYYEADAMNRIPMFLRPLLIDCGGERVLIDCGVGDGYEAKFARIYKITREKGQLMKSLEESGFRREDITHVIFSHLHFDHCGSATFVDESGATRIAFPNAQFFVSLGEWEFTQHLNERTRPSYRLDWIEPLAASGRLRPIREEGSILPGMSYLHTPGHLPHHHSILVQNQGEVLIYWGDIMPLLPHLRPTWISAIDTHPLESLEQKKKLLKQAEDEGWHYHYFYHEKKPLYTAEEVEEFLHTVPGEAGP